MNSGWRLDPDRAVLAGIVLSAVTYCRDLRYDFIFDDVPLILMNENLVSWRNWKPLFFSQIMPFQNGALHYRPVYMLWFMLNQMLFGLIVPWWHLTSMVLFFVAIFLVYRLGLAVLKDPWAAAVGALLFAFHPIHVESVCYITAASDLLVTVFVLAAFFAYYQFREKVPKIPLLLLSLLAAALAAFSKETGLMLPFALLAYEMTRDSANGKKSRLKGALWTLPHFGVVIAYYLVRSYLLGSNLGSKPESGHFLALSHAPLVLLSYLRNLIWPVRLSFFYPPEWTNSWSIASAIGFVLVALVVLALWRYSKQRTGLRMQLLWFTVFMVPPVATVMVFSQSDWVHDRHMFLPSVPFCLIAGWLLSKAGLSEKAAAMTTSLVLAVFFALTSIGIPRFSDEVSVYASSLRVAPNSFSARHLYAWALWNRGRREDALREMQRNVELWPDSSIVHEYYATALAETGRDADALLQYNKVIALAHAPNPARAAALYHAAAFQMKFSQYEEAERNLREAIQIDPQAPNYHGMLAAVLENEGKNAEVDELRRIELQLRLRQSKLK